MPLSKQDRPQMNQDGFSQNGEGNNLSTLHGSPRIPLMCRCRALDLSMDTGRVTSLINSPGLFRLSSPYNASRNIPRVGFEPARSA